MDTSRAATEASGWREALRGYGPATSATSDSQRTPERPAGSTPLALQFQLRRLIRRTPSRWNGPVSTAAKAVDGVLDADHRLGIRPVVRTSRGWARSGITWANIPHLVNRLGLDPAQHRWFCEVGALHLALRPTAPGRDPDWIHLDDFANPVLWELLDQTASLSIQLVGAGPTAQVSRAISAIIAVDVVRDATGLHVGPRLTLDDSKASTTHARAIGNHGIYLVEPAAPQHIRIAPTSELLTADQLAVLAGSATTVPEQDVDEFLQTYLPDLRERVEVTSSDRSVPLPPQPPPILVASVTHSPRHTVLITWWWQAGRRSAPTPPLEEVLPPGLLPAEWLGGEVPLGTPLPSTLTGIDAAVFADTTLRTLLALPGVRVERHGTAPDYRELTGTPHLAITTVPSDRHDWLDLGVTVTVDGHVIPFVPLFKALASGKRRLLLVDGTYLSLAHPTLRALSELIEESRDLDEWEPVPSISRHQLSVWSDFEDLADEAVPAVQWRALLAESKDDAPRAVDPPARLHATLRPYQRDGLDWLAFLWRHQLGGVLADDMGLGKTLQCLALIQHIVESTDSSDDAHRCAPFLIVAPTSVVPNWMSEARRFAPGLTVRQVSSTEAAGRVPIRDMARGADVLVTSYALLRLDFDAYRAAADERGWAGLVLDEAQFVKNPASKVHAAALDLPVRFKLAVTGTPLENSLTDLWALFAIVAPGLFASAPRFHRDYVRPIEQPRTGITRGVGAGDAPAVNAAVRAERLATLRRRIRPFLLRRTKELVAGELPAKQEQTLRIDLAPEHRELYEKFLQRERQKLFQLLGEDLRRNKFILFRSLTLLRLLALDASLLGEQYADVPSSKLDALFDLLDDVLAGGHRALVFSQFTSYLTRVARRLDAAGIAHVYLDGNTRNRGQVLEAFQSGSAPVFLISLKAGGFGLNLTEADYVFLLDPWWNPAAQEQAVDRTHRIGQDKHVMVYRLVAADTIEEKVLELQQRKAGLFHAVIDDRDLFGATLSADDVRGLLA